MNILTILFIVSVATGRTIKYKYPIPFNDFFSSESNNYESFEPAVSESENGGENGGPETNANIEQTGQTGQTGGDGKQGQGFSAGSGLRSIAQGSADQANNAVLNQKAAADQAAYVAKNTLAQAAAAASATAQAALAGKQILLQGVEQQVQDARTALDGESMQLQQAQRSATASQQASQQAAQQVNVIQAALNAAQATAENAQQSASEAAGELAAQMAMVGSAKQRLQTLMEQLHAIRIDFEATQAAALRAQQAAQTAQANAAAAAAEAAKALESDAPRDKEAIENYDNNYNLYDY